MCLPLPAQVVPLRAELIIKEMGSTMEFFQDQQPDKQNYCQFMTFYTRCVPLIRVWVKYEYP